MADNRTIRNASGTSVTMASDEVSSNIFADRVRVTNSDGTKDIEVDDVDGALDERVDGFALTAAALMGTDAAASAGAKLVPLQAVSTAVPILKAALYNAAGTALAGSDVDGALDERLDVYQPVAAALMAADAAASAGSKQVPVGLYSTAVHALLVVPTPVSASGVTVATKLAQSGTVAEITDSACTVYSITATNSHSAAAFLQVFNTDDGDVTAGTTDPALIIEMPAGQTVHLPFPFGLPFGTGLSIAATTGRKNNTTATANTVDVTIGYK